MLVKLNRNWLGPDGHLYRADSGGTEVPAMYKDRLPKTAEVLKDGGKKSLSEEDHKVASESEAFSSKTAAEKAAQAGLSADDISGTGSGGKITVKDVEKAADDGSEGVLAKDTGSDRQAQAAMDEILKKKKAE